MFFAGTNMRFLLLWVIASLPGLIGSVQAEEQRCVLLIGDSHGAAAEGWASQLISSRKDITFVNTSISGNTIGFDNLGREELNTLKNAWRYVRRGQDSCPDGQIDDVVILLGTNDCKAVFEHRQHAVSSHLSTLIDTIRVLTNMQRVSPTIYVVSPPPYGPESLLADKYTGAGARLNRLLPGLMEVALNRGCAFIDVYSVLLPDIEKITVDGVHLTPEGSKRIARTIDGFLSRYAPVAGDDTREMKRDPRMRKIQIVSSADSTIQPVYYYPTSSGSPKPLVVRLHSWSGDYTQHDPLAQDIIDRDWNYIFPNFRGPNNTPQACGSPLVIPDIEDAIRYAIDNGQVDESSIHVVGSSGGGHATLLMYMKSRLPIRSFSAWVPISDLLAWYYQSAGRGNKYAGHILQATGSTPGALQTEEIKRRSPLYMNTPVSLRKNTRLDIYAGIHDGYTGSVPVSQSIAMYNKIVADFGGAEKGDLIDCQTTLDLVAMRTVPQRSGVVLGNREVLLHRQYGSVAITIFEGSHEMLPEIVLQRLILN